MDVSLDSPFAVKRKLKTIKKRKAAVDTQLKELTKTLEVEEVRSKALADFYFFAKEVMWFRELYEPLHKPLCDIISNPRIKRKLILLPRGHFKTTLISISFPLWVLLRDRNQRIALCSTSAGKSTENMEEIIARARSDRFTFYFSRLLGHPDDWPRCSRDYVRIKRQGSTTGPSLAAYGVDSSEVGRHFGIMLLDDIVDQEKVNTMTSRDNVWSWFGRQLSVLDPGSQMIVLGTRWHWDDPYSRIQERLECYTDDEKDRIRSGEELPQKWWVEKRKVIENGKLIFPTRFSQDELNEIKHIQGDYIFSCFYYNEPTGEGMNPFDIRRFKWIDYCEPEECDSEFDQLQTPYTHIYVDPAASEGTQACYSALVVADALYTRQIVIKEVFLEKLAPDSLINRLFELVQIYNPVRVVIEEEIFQKSLIYWMRREQHDRNMHFRTVGVKIPRNVQKYARLDALQPFVHGGDIIFKADMRGRRHIEDEFETYPKGPHDDIIAAMAMIPHATIYPPRISVESPRPKVPRSWEFLEGLVQRSKRHRGYMPRVKVKRWNHS